MENKKITIDDLAMMVQRGFNGTDEKMGKGFRDVDARFEKIDDSFEEVNSQFNEVRIQFKEVNVRLDRIENIILKQHGQQIESLELRIKRLEDTLAIK